MHSDRTVATTMTTTMLRHRLDVHRRRERLPPHPPSCLHDDDCYQSTEDAVAVGVGVVVAAAATHETDSGYVWANENEVRMGRRTWWRCDLDSFDWVRGVWKRKKKWIVWCY